MAHSPGSDIGNRSRGTLKTHLGGYGVGPLALILQALFTLLLNAVVVAHQLDYVLRPLTYYMPY